MIVPPLQTIKRVRGAEKTSKCSVIGETGRTYVKAIAAEVGNTLPLGRGFPARRAVSRDERPLSFRRGLLKGLETRAVIRDF
jgi:hypothetical protein